MRPRHHEIRRLPSVLLGNDDCSLQRLLGLLDVVHPALHARSSPDTDSSSASRLRVVSCGIVVDINIAPSLRGSGCRPAAMLDHRGGPPL